jgi:thiol-disulfide isomerase/thioredoxin
MMRYWKICVGSALLLAIALPAISDDSTTKSATAAPATTAPAPGGVQIPEETIKNLEDVLRPTARPTREDLTKRAQQVIADGEQLEKQYPKASNLYRVRLTMMMAANGLFRIIPDEHDKWMKETLKIAQRLVDSDAPAKEKLAADALVTKDKIATEVDPKVAQKEVTDFVARYAKSDAVAYSLLYAAMLARETNQAKLLEEFLQTLEQKYLEEPGVRTELRADFDRHPDIGKDFTAKLTKVDGTPLNLPGDLKGKAYIVDFWATWCGPCVASQPEMKEIYKKYKDRGLEIVGVSLDESKDDVVGFAKTNEIPWIQTWSEGKKWAKPTALKYGIAAIPSVWVVGKDGKVVSDDARSDEDAPNKLQDTVKKALNEEQPATAPVATTAPADK